MNPAWCKGGNALYDLHNRSQPSTFFHVHSSITCIHSYSGTYGGYKVTKGEAVERAGVLGVDVGGADKVFRKRHRSVHGGKGRVDLHQGPARHLPHIGVLGELGRGHPRLGRHALTATVAPVLPRAERLGRREDHVVRRPDVRPLPHLARLLPPQYIPFHPLLQLL